MMTERNWGDKLMDDLFRGRDEIAETDANIICDRYYRNAPNPDRHGKVHGWHPLIAQLVDSGLLRWKSYTPPRVLERQTPEKFAENCLTQSRLDEMAAARADELKERASRSVPWQSPIDQLRAELAELRAGRT